MIYEIEQCQSVQWFLSYVHTKVMKRQRDVAF